MGAYDGTSLFHDDPVPTHRGVTILNPAADLKRGTVMGRITASGKWTTSLSGASDGSQVPRGILAFDIANPAADVKGAVYDQGTFVAEKLIYGTGHTAATVEAACAAASINIRVKSIGAAVAV